MELDEVMTTTAAVREFTDDPLPDEALQRILDRARFAPSGGNRQGTHVIVVRDETTRRTLAEYGDRGARRYVAQIGAGENPWNTVIPTGLTPEQIDETPVLDRFVEPFLQAPVVLVVSVDLSVVASMDQDLDRIGVISGASVYPFVWNVLLQARQEGFGGTITTMAVAREPDVRALLGLPESHAIAAVMPLGRPVKQLTRLKRKAVGEFVTRERYDGAPFAG